MSYDRAPKKGNRRHEVKRNVTSSVLVICQCRVSKMNLFARNLLVCETERAYVADVAGGCAAQSVGCCAFVGRLNFRRVVFCLWCYLTPQTITPECDCSCSTESPTPTTSTPTSLTWVHLRSPLPPHVLPASKFSPRSCFDLATKNLHKIVYKSIVSGPTKKKKKSPRSHALKDTCLSFYMMHTF